MLDSKLDGKSGNWLFTSFDYLEELNKAKFRRYLVVLFQLSVKLL